MIDNKVGYEVDGSGSYINQTIGSVRALTDYTTILELITPLPLNTSVMVNFTVYDSRNIDLPQFLIPTPRKGSEVSNNPAVADWYVFETGIDQRRLLLYQNIEQGELACRSHLENVDHQILQ